MLLIEWKLVRSIHQNKTCPNLGRENSTADNRVVFFTTAVELPCGLEQYEEFARCSPMLRSRRNADHVRSVITALRLIPRGRPPHLNRVQTGLGLLPRREQDRFYSNLLRGPPHRSSPTASKNCDLSRVQVWSRYTR